MSEYPVCGGCQIKKFRILNSSQVGIRSGGEIDRGFLLSNSPYDAELEIGVRLKANTQAPDSLILALAR